MNHRSRAAAWGGTNIAQGFAKRARRVVGSGALALIIALGSDGRGQAAAARPDATIEAPIRIDNCVVLTRTILRDPFNGFRANEVSGLSLTFTNTRVSSATQIRLRLRYQGVSETIEQHGRFGNGIPIVRTVAAFIGSTPASDAATCDVEYAAFTDGTTWSSAP